MHSYETYSPSLTVKPRVRRSLTQLSMHRDSNSDAPHLPSKTALAVENSDSDAPHLLSSQWHVHPFSLTCVRTKPSPSLAVQNPVCNAPHTALHTRQQQSSRTTTRKKSYKVSHFSIRLMAVPVGGILAVGLREEFAEERQVHEAVDIRVVEKHGELVAQQVCIDAPCTSQNRTMDVLSANVANGKFLDEAEGVWRRLEGKGVAALKAVKWEDPDRLVFEARVAASNRDLALVVNDWDEQLGATSVIDRGEDAERMWVHVLKEVAHHADEVIRPLDGIERSDAVSDVREVICALQLKRGEERLAGGIAEALDEQKSHLAQLCSGRRVEGPRARSTAEEEEAALLGAGSLLDHQSILDQLLLGLAVESVAARKEPQHLGKEVRVRLNAVQELVELLASADDGIPSVGEIADEVAPVGTLGPRAGYRVLMDETVMGNLLTALGRPLGKEEGLSARQQHLRGKIFILEARATVDDLSNDFCRGPSLRVDL
mmetsp:Transcript_22720/g.64983  ORF Transcript_22720/g.64983 Transcript_22720/m.64983 type:complete len:487 (+) Transcript_22720:177-1637(+)